MMGETPHKVARMIVNQEIQEEDLQDVTLERITRDSRDFSTETFMMPPTEITVTTSRKKPAIKSVRFPEKLKEMITVRYIPRATTEENAMLWYSSEELDRIQDQADDACSRAMSIRQGCKGFLDNVFLTKSQQANLNCWCRYSESLRGFEHVVNKHHSVERYVQKSIAIQSVLLAQTSSRDRMTEIKMSETVARISKRCSRRAREFATAMGAADEYVELLERRRTSHSLFPIR